jgi:hypothetical protein
MDLHRDDNDEIKQQRQMLIAQAAAAFVNINVAGALSYVELLYNKMSYHTFMLAGGCENC